MAYFDGFVLALPTANKEKYLSASRRALAASAAALALAGCDMRSADSSQAPAAPGNEAAREAPAPSQPTRTGYANVEGGRIYYHVHGVEPFSFRLTA